MRGRKRVAIGRNPAGRAIRHATTDRPTNPLFSPHQQPPNVHYNPLQVRWLAQS
jgi:hypothetical protein